MRRAGIEEHENALDVAIVSAVGRGPLCAGWVCWLEPRTEDRESRIPNSNRKAES